MEAIPPHLNYKGNQMIDYSTASHAELEAAGLTVNVCRSQATRKRKSLFGVRPSMNKSKVVTKSTPANAKEAGKGKMQG